MRQRRHGDPQKVGRAGRPRDGKRAAVLAVFGDDAFSPRGFQRYWTAHRLLMDFGDRDAFVASHGRTVRPNGSINIAAMQRESWRVVFEYIAQHPDE